MRLGQAPPPLMPSLCVTGALSQVGRCDIGSGESLMFTIVRPRQLHDTHRPPLVVCHGGPSIPSNYLLPLVNGVTDRAVILYDQYGCGKSSRPRNVEEAPFSIALMVEHLQILLTKQWELKKYHLLGHSFGGILAYEYLLQASEVDRAACQSLILVSTPTDASQILRESKRLYREVNGLKEDIEDDKNDNEETAGDDDPSRRQLYSERFRETHECRLPHTPLPLIDAMAQAGPTNWRGAAAISNYCVTQSLHKIPSLLLRGEYDFCTKECMERWSDILIDPPPEWKTLSNCSHYAMLEDERQCGKVISEFLVRQDSFAK